MARTALVSSIIGLAVSATAGPRSATSAVARRGIAATGGRTDRLRIDRTPRADQGAAAPIPGDVSRSLAIEWLATLEDRPFRPSAEQLDWVDGGDLVIGEARARRMHVAAPRFAGLFADHVASDMSVEGGPGAYALVWQCARRAFIESQTTGPVRDADESGRSGAV